LLSLCLPNATFTLSMRRFREVKPDSSARQPEGDEMIEIAVRRLFFPF